MPMLRSLDQKVEVIDDRVFAEKALARLQLGQFSKLRFYLANQNNGEGIATSLFYRTSALTLPLPRQRAM